MVPRAVEAAERLARGRELGHPRALGGDRERRLAEHRGRAAALDAAPLHGDGVFRGVGTSRGTVTGTARVVKTLKEIGRIKEGEILVTNSTDPGWTPAFLLIKGIVLETGGLLAHGALLAREFGFPGVQIASALQHIPDGATISLDGDAGIVVLESTPDTSDPRADDLVPA